MDPDACLEQIRAICDRVHEGEDHDHDAGDLADLFDNLDAWLTEGGFLPTDWKKGFKP